MILYEGKSLLDSKPIVVLATGYDTKSANSKTGEMIQTFILRQDVSPTEALKTGDDVSVCGDCKHRDGSCYVTVFHAPLSTWKRYKRGNHPSKNLDLLKGKFIRFGSYGDPAAVPAEVWQELKSIASGTTGYTHQWHKDDQLKGLCMASTDTAEEYSQAIAKGWRSFRVRGAGETMQRKEIVCPASEEAGKKLSCIDCRACGGADGRKSNIVISVHGSKAKQNKFNINIKEVS